MSGCKWAWPDGPLWTKEAGPVWAFTFFMLLSNVAYNWDVWEVEGLRVLLKDPIVVAWVMLGFKLKTFWLVTTEPLLLIPRGIKNH